MAPGERVVLHSHPHWVVLALPSVVFLVAVALAGTAGGFVSSSSLSSGAKSTLWIVIAVVWLALVIWFFIRDLVNWWTTHFVVTDRRVMYRNGIVTRSSIDIPVTRINSVEFRESILDRVLRAGTLEIESASADPLSFKNIPNVREVHKLLYNEVLDRQDGWQGGPGQYPNQPYPNQPPPGPAGPAGR